MILDIDGDNLTIENTKLREIGNAIDGLRNLYDVYPNNIGDFNIRYFQDIINNYANELNRPEITVKAENEMLINISFSNPQFNDEHFTANIHIEVAEDFSKYMPKIVRALEIGIPNANIPDFLFNVFGKGIISKEEIHGVWPNAFDNIANNQADIAVFDNYIILINHISPADENQLEKILNKLDSPRKVFRSYAKMHRDYAKNHQVVPAFMEEFFKNIDANYSRLVEAEADIGNQMEHSFRMFFYALLLVILPFLSSLILFGNNDNGAESALFLSLTVSVLVSTVLSLLPKVKSDMILRRHRFELASVSIIVWSVMYFFLEAYSLRDFEKLFESVELFLIFLGVLAGSGVFFFAIDPEDYNYLRASTLVVKITPAISAVFMGYVKYADPYTFLSPYLQPILLLPWSQPVIWLAIAIMTLLVKKQFWKKKQNCFAETYPALDRLFGGKKERATFRVEEDDRENDNRTYEQILVKKSLCVILWGLIAKKGSHRDRWVVEFRANGGEGAETYIIYPHYV